MLIRIKSHRCRQKLESCLGYLPQGYFSFYIRGEFREISEAEYLQVKDIKGLTKARVETTTFHKCLDWSYSVPS